jgi:glutamate/tyrosine decarboxylase-like PLP-dependent enzyme
VTGSVWGPLFDQVSEHAQRYRDALDGQAVAPPASVESLRKALGGDLPDEPSDPAQVIAHLVEAAEPGLVASAGPRFFGFVVGGSLPAAVAADWLASAWDQNSGLHVLSPAAAVVEEVVAAWLAELFGLPDGVSVGLVTGGQMANFACLAAARHHVLGQAGWDVEADGLQGAPQVTVVAGQERHFSIDAALRYLGLGARMRLIPADSEGRMRVDELATALDGVHGPTIVCAQAGDVNSGAFDPLDSVCDAAREHGAWVHVDGAFGLWAAASPARRHLVAGLEQADSWATDAHKWLNVPYDSGLAFCAHPEAHRAAMTSRADYLVPAEHGERDAFDWTPEASRRGRGFAVYAAIRSLGRSGIAELVDRCCEHARRFADRLGEADGVEVCNDVVLNQVLARFGDDERTREVIRRVQADGTCWLGGTVWRGKAAMRISVVNWSTTTEDVDRSVDAILRAVNHG